MVSQQDLLTLLEQRTDIAGRFTKLQRVGSGGGTFSALVSADDAHSGRRVAVKVCLPNLPTYRVECFDREAQILGLLQGEPDIVQLVSGKSQFIETVSTQGGMKLSWPFDYYSLELAKTDFESVIADGGWPPELSLVAFRELVRAVQRIHTRRIAHRDLKPGNMLVMPDRTIKLSDFGTARVLDGTTGPLLAAYPGPPGDRRYCAPEMLGCLHDENPEIAFASDFFSLGAILFEMFAGTNLGLRLFNPQFWADIAQAMLSVKPGMRKATYDQIVGSIANSRPIPSVAAFGPVVPPAIRDRLDELCRSLAAIDYRTRLCDFDRIFNRINVCLIIIRNDQAYRRWLDQKRSRRSSLVASTSGVMS